MRILVVDDEPMMLRALVRVLADHDVLTASDYAAALTALEDHDTNLMIADYDLGCTKTGVDLLAAAARLQPQAARVLMSGSPHATSRPWSPMARSTQR